MKTFSKHFLPRTFLLMLLLAFSGVNRVADLRAQATIGFGSIGLIGLPDTVYAGDSILVGSYIKNYAPLNDSVYYDTIQVKGYIDTAGGPPGISFILPPVSPQFYLPLQPGDSMFFILPIDFRDSIMGGIFRIGNNVIVVWPISFDPHFSTLDSITVNVFLIDSISSVGPEHNQEGGVKCYPIPASGPLYVTTGSHSTKIKEVVVYDATGKIICVSKSPSLGIDTQPWSSGIYLLEVIFENGTKSSYKVIR